MTNKDAIERLNLMQERCCNGYDAEAINCAIKALEERPQGEWITHYEAAVGFSWLTCSRCLYRSPCIYNFCPDCGAKMRKET